eukprot:TRINITY_DN67959_c0_g1_i1.p1 TRINITY_DN67959_c0_g1~~TRINITY_DN67959_c0_g1_i1.p1  ORF type:complete len:925 (+),score=165.99 TRINITY_DN67959_c0_g1_i1:55-2829(+)
MAAGSCEAARSVVQSGPTENDASPCAGGEAVVAKPCSFRLFSDRSAAELEAFEWNASMDLLACLTTPPDSTLSIYRLLAEDRGLKILSEKISGIGTALAWSPCGRHVAVGDRLGGIAVIDGESGAVLSSQQLHHKPVAALSWVAAGAPASGEVTGIGADVPWSRMLPPLLAVPTAPGNMYADLPDVDLGAGGVAGGALSAEAFTLLVSADEGGIVVVSAGGRFMLQETNMLDDAWWVASTAKARPPSAVEALRRGGLSLAFRQVRSVRLSPDLRLLAVMFSQAGDPPPAPSSPSSVRPPLSPLGSIAGTPGIGGSAVKIDCDGAKSGATEAAHGISSNANDNQIVVVLDVRKLAVRRRELAQCSGMATRLLSVITYTRKAVETMTQVWRGASDTCTDKMSRLSEAVETYHHGGSACPSAHEELLVTCCTGTPTDAVHAFLTRYTSPQQLTRLERQVLQALEYVNLVVCTRLQLASQHLLTTLQELLACASWTQRFRAIGLDVELLQLLLEHTRHFARLTELLLLDCNQTRRFVRTLFQVLLHTAQRLNDQPPGPGDPPGGLAGSAGAPSKEDMDEFVNRMERRQSLEMREISERISGVFRSIGAAAGAVRDSPKATPPSAAATPSSLAAAVQMLTDGAEVLGRRVVAALSARCAPLACFPLWVPSAWSSVVSPELRAAAAAMLTVDRGTEGDTMGSSYRASSLECTLSMAWEDSASDKPGARLVLLWAGGGRREANLHVCRVWIPPEPPGVVPSPPKLELLQLCAGGPLPTHFLLCQLYDASRVVALLLRENASGGVGATATVCLITVSNSLFRAVDESAQASDRSSSGGATVLDSDAERRAIVGIAFGVGDGVIPFPPPIFLRDLPEGCVRSSETLPDSFVWSTALRAMSTREVCSIYSRRARRLLTLDMAEDDEDDDAEDGD